MNRCFRPTVEELESRDLFAAGGLSAAANPELYLSTAAAASSFPLIAVNLNALGALSLASSAFSSLTQDPYCGNNLNHLAMETHTLQVFQF